METDNIRNTLAEYFRAKAQWRAQKAEAYPADIRNRRSAESLVQLAEYIARMPDTAPLLARFAEFPMVFSSFDGGVLFLPPTPGGCECERMAGRFGFDGSEEPGQFLDNWFYQVVVDYSESLGELMIEFHGRPEEGDLAMELADITSRFDQIIWSLECRRSDMEQVTDVGSELELGGLAKIIGEFRKTRARCGEALRIGLTSANLLDT